ncbi:hypothetical protein HanPSC8_Chr08g0342831 [Helianthus annuus]|nr:hypothetical protein HanPSC8_Chr08g0342831 [Helianthus annuus]
MTHSYKLQHKSDYYGSILINIWSCHPCDDGHTTIGSSHPISDVLSLLGLISLTHVRAYCLTVRN